MDSEAGSPILLAVVFLALLALFRGPQWLKFGAALFLSLVVALIASSAVWNIVFHDTNSNTIAWGAAIGLAAGVGVFLLLRRWTAKLTARASALPHSPPRSFAPSTQSIDIFISYKRDERALVHAIAERLKALKLSVWFDADIHSGKTFDAEIDRHVRSAKCVLVCWSPGAVASDWVRGEATIGRQRNVLAATMLVPCDLPAPFNLVHANDLTNGIGPGNGEWLHALDRIGALVGRPGLAAFERLESSGPAAFGEWIARNAGDPLLEEAVRRLKALPV
ncbi:MAG: toll/interleukin-1 receptor domain-containing protein [Terricaulis sp.]